MTRINCIPTQELSDKHLGAEYRELPRVFKLAYAAWQRGEDPATYPQQYVLGTGHVRFFYTRLGYLERRAAQLYLEMRRRGWKPRFDRVPDLPRMPASWRQDWLPDAHACALNRARIAAKQARAEARRAGRTGRPLPEPPRQAA